MPADGIVIGLVVAIDTVTGPAACTDLDNDDGSDDDDKPTGHDIGPEMCVDCPG